MMMMMLTSIVALMKGKKLMWPFSRSKIKWCLAFISSGCRGISKFELVYAHARTSPLSGFDALKNAEELRRRKSEGNHG
jgi:hypothetical protein